MKTQIRLRALTSTLLAVAVLATGCSASTPNSPPSGMVALFNGHDLSGWRGGDTFDPRKLAAMTGEARQAQIDAWTLSMREHWRVQDGELINDGQGAYATTEQEYGDFELRLEYRTVAGADSGIYLRGCPQVQIWDFTDEGKFSIGGDKGSGGLWNNSPGAPGKDPSVLADRPFGEWNVFRIVMVGSRVSVWLNGLQVVQHALMENYYDRALPVPARGPIQLQTHGGEIRWRNLFLREIEAKEANEILSNHGEAGFERVFNGRDFAGWEGATQDYAVREGALSCRPERGGTLFTREVYADFAVRLEFNLPASGNNGLAIRYPGTGDAAYGGMCELQVLDNTSAAYADLDARQYHGSVYGIVPAQRGYLRPPGTWNFQEVTVHGSTIRVELNGTVILDSDVSQVTSYLDNNPHPGKDLKSGHFGFAGHNDPVAFRNIRIRRDDR